MERDANSSNMISPLPMSSSSGGGCGGSSDAASRADSEQDSVEAMGSQMASPGQLLEDERRRSEQLRKLFVGGLASFVSDDLLKDFFSDFGDITDVVVMKDSKTGRSRGFGFVTFREPEMVDAAQAARPHILGGKQVETKRAMPREDSDKPEAHMTVKKLFVGALKKTVTSEDLRQYFTDFGHIEEAEVMTWKETGESRGFGFVTFDDYDPVDKCILYKPHCIRSSKADVKKALSKEEMTKVKAKQEQQKLSNSPAFSPTAALKLAAANQSSPTSQAAFAPNQAPIYYPSAYQSPPTGGPPGFALSSYPPYSMPPPMPHMFGPTALGPLEYFGSYAVPDPRYQFNLGQLPPAPGFPLPTLLHTAPTAADPAVGMEFAGGTVPRWSEVYQ